MGDHLGPSYYYQLVCPGAAPGRADVLETRALDYVKSPSELRDIVQAVREDAGVAKNWKFEESINFTGSLVASSAHGHVQAGQLIGRLNCFYGENECAPQLSIAMSCARNATISDRTYAGGMNPRIILSHDPLDGSHINLEFRVLQDVVLSNSYLSLQEAQLAASYLKEKKYTWSTHAKMVFVGCVISKTVIENIVVATDANQTLLGVLQLSENRGGVNLEDSVKLCSSLLPQARVDTEGAQRFAFTSVVV